MNLIKNYCAWRNVILFLQTFLMIGTNHAYSNNYVPFPSSNAIWNVTWTDASCFNSGIPDGVYTYYIGGDTIINSVNYHTIYRSGLCLGCCSPPNFPLNGYIGAYRNDSVNKKVYWINASEIFDTLLYDFDLSVGDTIIGPLAQLCTDAIVTSIDSALYGNFYRKIFHISGVLCNGEIIEGIGSTLGLIEPMKNFDGGGILNCFKLSTETIYPDSSTNCSLITHLPENEIINESFFIATFNEGINVIFNNDDKLNLFSIEVWDSSGKIVLEGSAHENIFIPIENSGLYLIKINFNKNDYSFFKCLIVK